MPGSNITLTSLSTQKPVRISDITLRPTVFVLGSATCPVFMERVQDIQALYDKYRNRANVYVVYVREAHPTTRPPYISQQTYAMRLQAACSVAEQTALRAPILVDGPENAMSRVYPLSGIGVYLIDNNGAILHNDPSTAMHGFTEVRKILDQRTR